MQTPWVWVYCRDYLCGHSRAVALTPWAIRWQTDHPAPLICERFRCVMCGKNAWITVSGLYQPTMTYNPFPVEEQLRIGGRRLMPESRVACEERCATIYESKRAEWSRFWLS